MCGIAGYISKSEWPGSAMVEALAHRGPDGKGAYAEQWGDWNVFLGHRRLAIIDLSEKGKQPMISHHRNGVIVFNGEIYNYRELAKALKNQVPLQSETDTEVLLESLARKGIDAVTELNGDFAFAYLDRHQEQLYLVRDRLGVKPLYYSWSEGTLRFGSEIKALLAGGLRPELDTDHLQRYFTFKYSPGSETLFRHVKRVPPGHFLRFDLKSGHLELKRYWEHKPVVVGNTYRDRCEELRELMRDAVEMRLVSDVPVSTFLSGGLDSSIIASFLRDKPQIMHYCAVKDEADIRAEGTTSDGAFADQLARKWNLNYTRLGIGSAELTGEMIDQTLRYSDDLIADGSQIPSWLIARKASEQSTVVLTGMGADELFYGYAGHIITRWAGAMDRLPKPLASGLAKTMASAKPGIGRFKAVKRYLYKLGRYYNHPQRFAPLSVVGDWNTSMAVYGKDDSLSELLLPYDQPGEMQRLENFERDNFLVKNLHYMDRMCMANGMESRVPFLDHRLAEWAYSLPFSDRLSGLANTKRILKDSFCDVLPHELVQRRKAGFGMPLRSLFSDRQKVDQLLNQGFFGNFEGFSVETINALIDEHQRGNADHSSIIYALISFERWYKMYIEN